MLAVFAVLAGIARRLALAGGQGGLMAGADEEKQGDKH